MFGVSYPDNEDLLGWTLLGLPISNIILITFFHSCKVYPSYSKLYEQGLAQTSCVPQSIKNININYRAGMFLCYFPSLVIVPVVAFMTLFLNNTKDTFLVTYAVYFWVNVSLLMIHFAKRCIESLFVHVYSRETGNLPSFCLIIYWYFTMTVAATYSIVTDWDTKDNIDIGSNMIIIIGVAVYLCGIIFNAYSHWKLSSIRQKNGDTLHNKYVTLHELGKLFEVLKAPHYFGEIVMFFALFITMRSVTMLLYAIAVAINLIWRVFQTARWYKTQIEEDPKASRAELNP